MTPGALAADVYSPLGERKAAVFDLNDAGARAEALSLAGRVGAVLIGLARGPGFHPEEASALDVALSDDPAAPAPFVGVGPERLEAEAQALKAAIEANPIAASVLCQVLRVGEGLGVREALVLESAAYSALLGGGEFRRWLSRRGPPPARPPEAERGGELVVYRREGELVTLTLSAPQERNAMSAAMRDALFEALAAVLDDPSRPRVILRGEGACFSTGGALWEFGQAGDLAAAHMARTQHSCALLLHELGERAEAQLHGACIGSGLEIPMAASRRLFAPGAFVQLPEIAMGLIPGAGGTASLPRAIGRQRTAYLALRGRRFRADALAGWGLGAPVRASAPSQT